MKLQLELLEKFVDLPTKDTAALRDTLNDLGLEVKDTSDEAGGVIFTIETLANRGDHLSAIGVAREFAARFLSSVKLPAVAAELSDRKTGVMVSNDTAKCLRYALLEMNIPQGFSIRPEIVKIIGVESTLHPFVQLLNYVQLELGQPMHAFDAEKVSGAISVVEIKDAAEIIGLDQATYKVPAGSIVIRDKDKILAVAGVIGCQSSMVTTSTKKVLVESATFDPVSVRKTARGMGISTDASYAFERGSDQEMVIQALKRVTYLASSAGAAIGSSASAHAVGLTYLAGKGPEKREISASIKNLREQLCLPRLNDVEITSRLKALGFGIKRQEGEDAFVATVPSWRLWDVNVEADLVEELARALSYTKVKLDLPPLDAEVAEAEPMEQLLQKFEPILLGNGFSEVITRSYYSAQEVAAISALDPKLSATHLALANSQERGYSHLRVTFALHHAQLCEQHLRRGLSSIKIYEFGRLFNREKSDGRYEHERDVLAISVAGRWSDNDWKSAESREQKISLLKGVVESLGLSLYTEMQFVPSTHKLLHPGFQAGIKVGRSLGGMIGLLHPQLKERLGLREDVIYLELEAEVLLKGMKSGSYQQPIDFPLVRRDLTLKVEPKAFAASVLRYISEAEPTNLLSAKIVDDFKKESEAFRRVTYRMVFQNAERTLESAEVDQEVSKVLQHLKEKHQLALAD